MGEGRGSGVVCGEWRWWGSLPAWSCVTNNNNNNNNNNNVVVIFAVVNSGKARVEVQGVLGVVCGGEW